MSFINMYSGGNAAAQGLSVMEAANLNNQALQLSRQGDHAGAEALHQQALEIKIAAVGRDSIQAALSRNALGETQLALGKLDEAEETLKEAVRVRNMLDMHSFDAAVSRENLAQVYEAKGNLDLAMETRLSGQPSSISCGNYNCSGSIFELKRLQKCGKCKCVLYCSANCQAQDWKRRHKRYCQDRR